jgi:hypothetical protein
MKKLLFALALLLIAARGFPQTCPVDFSPLGYPITRDANGNQRAWDCIQSATGLLARNVYDPGAAIWNVKAYGAKGDGVTDDSAAILAALAALPAAGGEIFFPCGTYLHSTQILPTKTVYFHGCGSLGTASAGTHQTTTLTWTGGATAQIALTSAGAIGSKISALGFNNTGTATVALELDGGSSPVSIEDVAIIPAVPYSIAAIRLGNSSLVVSDLLKNVIVDTGGPIAIQNLRSNAVMGIHLHLTRSATYQMQLGAAGTPVIGFNCYNCILDEPLDGSVGLFLNRVQSGGFYGGYIEQGNTASAVAYSIETTGAATINEFNFVGVSFRSVRATASTAAIHQNFAPAQYNVIGCQMTGFANPSYFLKSDAPPQGIILQGNTSTDAGAAEVTGAGGYAGITTLGNIMTSALQPSSFPSGIRTDGGGFKHQNITTGSVPATTYANVTLTWNSAFLDTNYDAQCTVLQSTSAAVAIRVDHIVSIAAANVVVTVYNGAAGALTGTLYCTGTHN